MTVPFRAHALVVAAGFFGVFAAFSSAQALSTTLSQDKTVANVSLACLYLIFTLFCIPAPKLVTHLGPKMSMIIGSTPYALFVLSFLHPGWATTLPSHALVGLGAPLLWTGQSVYLSRCAQQNAYVTGSTSEQATSYFNGLFFALFSVTGFIGTLASSLILNYAGDNATTYLFIILSIFCCVGVVVFMFTPTIVNHTVAELMSPVTVDTPALLAAHGIQSLTGSALNGDYDDDALVAAPPSLLAPDAAAHGHRHADGFAPASDGGYRPLQHGTSSANAGTTASSFTTVDSDTTALRLVVPGADGKLANDDDRLLLLDPKYGSLPPPPSGAESAVADVSVFATLKLAFTEARFYTLIPVIFYHGMSQGFVFGDVTSIIVKTVLGANTVPYFLCVYFSSSVVLNYAGGRLAATKLGRRGVTVIAAAAHITFTLWALLWAFPTNFESVTNPDTGDSEEVQLHGATTVQYVVCFAAAFLYATGDSVYMGQIPAILQSFFKASPRDSDAAMSALKLFQSFGTAVQFALGFFLEKHYKVKAAIVVALHLLGVLGIAVLNFSVQPLDAASSAAGTPAAGGDHAHGKNKGAHNVKGDGLNTALLSADGASHGKGKGKGGGAVANVNINYNAAAHTRNEDDYLDSTDSLLITDDHLGHGHRYSAARSSDAGNLLTVGDGYPASVTNPVRRHSRSTSRNNHDHDHGSHGDADKKGKKGGKKATPAAPVSSAVSGDVGGRAFQNGAVGQVHEALTAGEKKSSRFYGED